jgi:hypothetical protein
LRTGGGPLLWGAEQAIDVLGFALAAYKSSALGGVGIHPLSLDVELEGNTSTT